MQITELLQDEAQRRREFPVCETKVFLAHAGVTALPRRVSQAVQDYAAQCTQGDQETLLPAYRIRKSRELAAKLIGASPEEVAFVGPTSLALSFVASGLRWKRHSNILVYFDDYPSNVYPWMALAEQGVEVRFINVRELGLLRAIDVLGQIDENTRMVALASCHFIAGYRIDIEAIGKVLREKKVLFCVDAIQTLGAFPMDVRHVDFLAADAHKWLLGPCAAGIFYVRRELQELLRPPVYGWHNVLSPNFVAQEQIQYPPDARKYEAGSDNLLGLVGLHAAMELLLEVGVENIAAELLRKRQWFVPELVKKGCAVLHAELPATHASGIISFRRQGTDMAALHRRMEEQGIVTSLRRDRQGREFIRVSPHFYNTDTELARVLEFL